ARTRENRVRHLVQERNVFRREGRVRIGLGPAAAEQRIAAHECDTAEDRGDAKNCFAPRDEFRLGHQRFLRFNSPTAKSAALAVSAMYVSEGFTHAADAMHDPS